MCLSIISNIPICIYFFSSLSFPSFIKDSSLMVGDRDLLLSRKGTCLGASPEISSLGLVKTSDPSVLDRKTRSKRAHCPSRKTYSISFELFSNFSNLSPAPSFDLLVISGGPLLLSE